MTSWFKSEMRYEGQGRAVFKNPAGEFSGPTVVTANATSGPEIVMRVKKCSPEQPEGGDWDIFFFCQEEEGGEHYRKWSQSSQPNPCSTLEVATPEGKVSIAKEVIDYTPDDDGFVSSCHVRLERLAFRPLQCCYKINTGSCAKYWVIPLIDYAGFGLDGPFRAKADHLACHPLRLFSNAGLITFSYAGRPAFIEALPNYKKTLGKVLGGRKQAITAIMVGELSKNKVELEDECDTYLPRLLFPLELATCSPLGTPWIEFRDEHGELVSRHHLGTPSVSVRRVWEVVECRDVGKLLEGAAQSKDGLDGAARSCITRLIESVQDGGKVEQAMSHIANACDVLIKKHKANKMPALAQLDHQSRGLVKGILSEAAGHLKALEKDLKSQKSFRQADTVKRIRDKLLAADEIGKFGREVRRLLEIKDFHDGSILEEHFSTNQQSNWEERVSTLRGIGVHSSLRYPDDTDSQLTEMWQVLRHLQDIVTRVLLKDLDYSGTYNPICFRGRGCMAVDWVKPSTCPSALGYDTVKSQSSVK